MMEYVDLFLTIASIVVSIFAALKAKSAAKSAADAVDLIIVTKNEQEDRDSLKGLISTLVIAKDAAMLRKKTTPSILSSGRPKHLDLLSLNKAQDALRTVTTFNLSEPVTKAISIAADEISIALVNIGEASNKRDGWTDAFSTLQNIIPQLIREEKVLRDKALRKV